MTKFEECQKFVDEFLAVHKDDETVKVGISVETKYLMCREYLEGYNAGQFSAMEKLVDLTNKVKPVNE